MIELPGGGRVLRRTHTFDRQVERLAITPLNWGFLVPVGHFE